MVRARLQMAESGQWEALLKAYLADTAAADSAGRSRYDRSIRPAPCPCSP